MRSVRCWTAPAATAAISAPSTAAWPGSDATVPGVRAVVVAVEARVGQGEQQRGAARPRRQREPGDGQRQERVRALPEDAAVVVVAHAGVAACQPRDVGLDPHPAHEPRRRRTRSTACHARAVVHELGRRAGLARAPAEVGVLRGREAVGLVEPAEPLEQRARVGDVAGRVVPVELGDRASSARRRPGAAPRPGCGSVRPWSTASGFASWACEQRARPAAGRRPRRRRGSRRARPSPGASRCCAPPPARARRCPRPRRPRPRPPGPRATRAARSAARAGRASR